MTTAKKKKGLALHWKIIIGLLLGIAWAFMSISFGWSDFTKNWISPFGDIFIRLLKFIAIPLVLFSIVSGVASLKDISKLGRVGAKTLSVYLLTTIFAVTVGLVIVNLVKPGNTISDEVRIKNRIQYELWVESEPTVAYKDSLRYLQDPKYAAIVSQITGQEVTENSKVAEAKANLEKQNESGPLSALVDMVPENIIISMSDPKLMLQVITFSIFFAVCLLFIPHSKSEPVLKFFDGMGEVFLKMVDIIMKAAPFFVFALMAGMLSKVAKSIDELQEILYSLGAYSGVVVAGLVVMLLLYPLFVATFVKKLKYMVFWRKIAPAQLMAFSTSSSAATLPVTMECVEKGVGVKPEIASFVLPIGATVNMDGTSLYQAVAVVYLAQIHLIDLTMMDQLMIVLTATLASIGSAAVPGAGLLMLMVVLSSVGLNPAWIAIILPVDRILDMCRTVVNVSGDAAVCTVIAASENELS
ncbi:MAG: dicarboxylate/amino acid:cation symporter [Crocinitomicaceae bacterium]|nr:dicarboxylate/amino acid:cation symporter [Crocinitomicaceae bacterium]